MITLDCTLRDGGYYNKWQFDLNLVNHYLKVLEISGIPAIEIGFRTPNAKGESFLNVTDEFINEKIIPPKIQYFGVMVNTIQVSSKIISTIFKSQDKSPINLVRAATHFKDVQLGEDVCKSLKALGYTVCINLMQAANKSFDEIRYTSEIISSWNSVDVLYLADSLGDMNHDNVNYAYKAIREGWNGLVGFHGHNNKGQSLSNSLEAVDIGVDWIDSTILGMGRGAGNTETEYLLGELNKRGFGEFELEPVYELALNHFLILQNQYGWGSSLLYYLAAEYNIHPTYIQKMLTDDHPTDKILQTVFKLKSEETNMFNEKILEESII